jgi:aspartate aminotransferase
MSVSKRLAAVPASVTLAITNKAAAMRAAGKDVIGFGAGEPDFPTPAHIVEAARRAAGDPTAHHYSQASGHPALREAIAEKTGRDSGLAVQAGNVVVTNGAKGAVHGACQALLDPGDEVLLVAPYWVSYPHMVSVAGGTTVVVPTSSANGFKASPDQLESARTGRTKALIFVSPSNPTGAVYTPAEVAAVGEWAAEHGIWVIADEIYEHLVYGDAVFSSLPVEVPGVAERCVVVNGVSKTYAMTGWRVGWAIAPVEVATAMGRFQSHTASNVSNVSQAAALEALTGPQESVAEMRAAFDRRRRVMHAMLLEIPGVTSVEPDGAFYEFPSVEGALGRPLGAASPGTSAELADALLEEAGIAVVPGEAFGAPGHVRLSFALSDTDLVTGLDRWKAAAGT